MIWKIIWTVLATVFGLFLLITINSFPETDYRERNSAFIECKIMNAAELCADLLD